MHLQGGLAVLLLISLSPFAQLLLLLQRLIGPGCRLVYELLQVD